MPDTPYFTTAEARAYPPLEDTSAYPDAAIDAARQLAEQALEDACGVAFVTRSATTTVSGDGRSSLMLKPRASAITAVTVDSGVYSAGDLAGLVVSPTGEVYNPLGWTSGHGNVVVTYNHGYTAPPLRVKRAAILLARRWLVESPLDERTTRVQVAEGGTIDFLTASVDAFDIPEVNAVVREYGYAVGV